MNDQAKQPNTFDVAPAPGFHPRTIWLAVIGTAAVLSIFGSIYQSSQTQSLRRQVASAQQDNQALHAKLTQSETELQNTIASLHQELTFIRQESDQGHQKAKVEATHHADQLAKILKEQNVKLSEALGQVKATTEQATAKLEGITTDVGSVKSEVGSVRTEVGSVKTDVGAVRTDLDATKSNLEAARVEMQRVRGDLGIMSGFVATNGKEIQMLRDLGDRNIYEFALSKTAGAQKVGDIQVVLRKADMKKNRYTLEVVADDKRVEKKDKGTNEPVQFYTAGSTRQPYELVVNQVKKDQVVGYLATPKVTVSRATASATVAQAR